MRFFVGVYPDERFVGALTAALDPWRAQLAVTWGRPEQWHVTLQFLGEWPEARVPELQEALAGIAERTAFTVRPGGLGGFPSLARPRVLFVHLDGGEQLARMADAVRSRVHAAWPDGPQDARDFRPHLTVARLRGRLSREDTNVLANIDLGDLPAFPVDAFRLVASDLASGGARHRDLACWRLRKKGE